VDAISPKPLIIWPQGTEHYKRRMRDEFALDHPVSRYRAEASGRLVPLEREVACPSLRTPAVLSDGSVCLCWYDALGESVVGNINASSFRAIWKRSEPFRTGQMAGGKALSICSECVGVGSRAHEIIRV
jgi:radical SAM protein with 4Fe4S-binding SPASM domain